LFLGFDSDAIIEKELTNENINVWHKQTPITAFPARGIEVMNWLSIPMIKPSFTSISSIKMLTVTLNQCRGTTEHKLLCRDIKSLVDLPN